MAFLLIKEKEIYCDVLAYYIIDGELYQLSMRRNLTETESKLPPVEIFKLYGCNLSKYSYVFDEFEEWNSTYYKSFDDISYDMSKAQEINKKDLEKAIKKAKSDIEKKFKDFPLDGTLYTSTEELGPYYDGEMCFQKVAKPKKKLINKSEENIARRLILEIEVLDGISSETKKEFIPFCRFIEQYKAGHNITIIDCDNQFEGGACTKYFEDYYY